MLLNHAMKELMSHHYEYEVMEKSSISEPGAGGGTLHVIIFKSVVSFTSVSVKTPSRACQKKKRAAKNEQKELDEWTGIGRFLNILVRPKGCVTGRRSIHRVVSSRSCTCEGHIIVPDSSACAMRKAH